jgi:hypothetical protein
VRGFRVSVDFLYEGDILYQSEEDLAIHHGQYLADYNIIMYKISASVHKSFVERVDISLLIQFYLTSAKHNCS